MKKFIKFSLWGLGGIVLVIIVSGIILINLDPNQYQDFIAGKVSEKIGRKFEIDQYINIQYYPWLGIEVSGVMVGNAKGFAEHPFFKADRLKFRIKTLPLLKKQIEMDIISINGAQINLAKNKAGISNWEDFAARPPLEEKSKIPSPEKEVPLESQSPGPASNEKGFDLASLAVLMLGGVDIQDAVITFDDRVSGENYQILDLDITIGSMVPGKPINCRLSFQAQASAPDISGKASLDGIIHYDLDAGKYQIKPLRAEAELKGASLGETPAPLTMTSAIDVDFKSDTLAVNELWATGLGTTLEGKVTLGRFQSQNPLVDMNLDIKGEDLALLFRVFEPGPLAKQLAGLSDRAFNMKTKIQANTAQGMILVPEIEINMLGAAIKGEVQTREIQSGTPSFKGRLTARGPDLPTLLQVVGQFEGKNSPMVLMGKRLAGSKNKAFHMETQFDVDFKTGQMDIPGFSFKALGITMDTHLVANRINTLMPSAKGWFKADGPDLPLVVELAGFFLEKDSFLEGLGRQLAIVDKKAFHTDVNLDVDMGRGRVHVPDLSLAGLGIALDGNITAQHLGSDKAVIDGRVSLEGRQLTQLLKALEQNDLVDILQSISMKTEIKGNLEELRVAPLWARAGLSGKQAGKSSIDLTLDVATRVSVNKETLALDFFSLKGLGLDAKGSFHAQQIMASPVYKGNLSLAQFNLRTLMKKLNQPLPATADARVFEKMAVKTSFSGSFQDVFLKDLDLVMDQTNIKGELAIKNFADPDIGFDLAMDKINADRYMPRAQVNGKPSKKKNHEKAQKAQPVTPETLAAATATQVPMEQLQALKIKGKFRVENLIVSRAHLQKVVANLDAKNGNIILAPLSANLYKGTYAGDIFLDAKGKLPRLTINSTLKGVEAEPLLKDLTGKAQIRGTGDVTAALTTEGANVDAFRKNLNGKMGFVFKNGAVLGFNAGKFLRSLKSLRENQSYQVAEEEETDFTAITGNPLVKDGVVFLNDLQGKSPALRVSGTGILADLVRETIDYTANATVVESSKGQAGRELNELAGITIPIYIKGSLTDPSISPDISAVISSFATNEIMEKLSEKLGIKILDSKTPSNSMLQAPDQKQKQNVSNPKDLLKQTLEKELGNIFKGLTN